MESILVSACLLGVACRYDGKSKPDPTVKELIKKYNLIPVCPEIFGGLPTPRPASEIYGSKVISSTGDDVTENYKRGAEETLRLAKLFNCKKAVLKEKSPSCGFGKIYDGTFSKTLIDGKGVTAALLSENGIKIFVESNCESL